MKKTSKALLLTICAVLLVAASVIIHFLRRKEDGSHEGN